MRSFKQIYTNFKTRVFFNETTYLSAVTFLYSLIVLKYFVKMVPRDH